MLVVPADAVFLWSAWDVTLFIVYSTQMKSVSYIDLLDSAEG